MGVRRNARFLSAPEKENFVRACVLMKADIVNPAASAAQRYSRWDQFVAIHTMIQSAFGPGAPNVNFGHGGSGAFSFLSWHRYFLYRFELQLQTYVGGVMLPYWDWTDPASIMTDDFLGPNGTVSSEVRSGYFAADAPGTLGGTNPTPAPAWWPAGLTGWRLPSFTGFGTFGGPLRRNLAGSSTLPGTTDLRQLLARADYSQFQRAAEAGTGLTSGHQLHNGLHGWIGGHMGNTTASPFDPIFYLHHCNIDRLWAMWQVDGHATEYPLSGGAALHHRNDLMFPWTGGAAGFGTSATISSSIPMPNFAALGPQTNGSTLDMRTAFGYTYDSIAVIGIGLDRTGSMNQLTPDPMITGAPDVSKWEAAKRGVSAFMQDSETVQNSGLVYVVAGVRTFRSTGVNDFASVLPSPGYGLIKAGGAHSRAAFDGAIAAVSPAGGTPLVDALVDVNNTMVGPPFGNVPVDERRYLAMLTDGMRTSGALISSIADGSFSNVAVFGLGFGTGADVDYATIAALVAKGGVTLPTTQVFHGENAGTIDKFFSDSLAAAIGFTTVLDPVLELFAGEHAHVDFQATSADDSFLIIAQGMDFEEDNWTFHLHGPGDAMVFGDAGHQHGGQGCSHHCCEPAVTAMRANGRLSLVVNRNNMDDECWVGTWRLMVAYKARGLGAMTMPTIGEFLVPVQAGPVRGPRYSRLLIAPRERLAVRSIRGKAMHALDERTVPTGRNENGACNAVVSIYARTQLRLTLMPTAAVAAQGTGIGFAVHNDVLRGSIAVDRSFARLIAPVHDFSAAFKPGAIPSDARGRGDVKYDTATLLAQLEKKNRALSQVRDEQLLVVQHGDGPLHLHIASTDVPGPYHVGLYIEGVYCPDHGSGAGGHGGHGGHSTSGSHRPATMPHGCGPDCALQKFTRILTASVAVAPARRKVAGKKQPARDRKKRR